MVSLVSPRAASAHSFAPAVLSLRSTGPGTYEGFWRATEGDRPPRFPCKDSVRDPAGAARPGIVSRTVRLDCRPGDLREVAFEAGERPVEVVVQLERAGKRTSFVVREPGTVPLPHARAIADVLLTYLALGFEHILLGADHLVLVTCLLLLARGRRALLALVTAFTVGHSVTLSLATLGLMSVPPAPTETAIALSVLLLALDAARGDDKPRVQASGRAHARHGPAAAFFFGLVHGLGFAGALKESGLPPDGVPWALLGFNLGVELGQLSFILMALMTVALARRGLGGGWHARARAMLVTAAGGWAVYWICGRVQALL
jgi:hydrogenase/urease accessory protein HupE